MIELLGLTELMDVRLAAQHLAHGKCSIISLNVIIKGPSLELEAGMGLWLAPSPLNSTLCL